MNRFLDSCSPVEGGFYACQTSDLWRLGVVLFAERPNGVAAIRKAERPGYAFSGLHALPGGMVRGQNPDARQALEASLHARAADEAGLRPEAIHPLTSLGPVVTSYLARGEIRYTLVAAYRADGVSAEPLRAADSSITAADWITLPLDFASFAPANRLILAHLLWPRLDPAGQDEARPTVTETLDVCARWARDVGVTRPPAPWAEPDDVEAWRAGWPGP